MFSLGDITDPRIEDWLRVQLFAESLALGLQLFAISIHLPSFAENVFDPLHVGIELFLYLPGPDDGAGDWWQISKLRHVERIRMAITLREFPMKPLYVLLDRVDETRLIFLYSASNL